MTRRTKLIAALSGVALLAVSAFLLFPALFPGLFPSEEVSKGSDAKIRAQDSSSGTGSLAKCTYSYESGAVRTVYSDGHELFKFQGGHRLEIEAKREAGDRTAVATYEDGTIRRETFPSGTTTRQMVSSQPSKMLWFSEDGSPRNAPEAGAYPDLWPKVGEFFGAVAEHPFEERPLMPAPRTLPDREREFGPRTSQTEDEYFIYEEYSDGTKYRYEKGAGKIRIVTPDYQMYEWSNEPPFFTFSSRVAVMCGSEGPYDVTYWADGTKRARLYPPGTTYLNFKDRGPVCEEWRDPDGNPRDPGSPEQYPEPALTEPMDISPPPS